jgi:hypothetical protein
MSLTGTTWAAIGPDPITEGTSNANGLVTSIAINPNNANVIYQGTAGGGVWRTTDGGTSWESLFDHQLALGIGEPAALAIDPSNTDTIYAGTGQRITFGTGNAAVFGPPDLSQGLFKSTDGGGSWIQLGSGFPAGNTGNAGQFIGQTINVVIVDPADSQILYLASTKGVFRSTNAGQNWTAGAGISSDTRSLVLDTSSPAAARILYAGVSGRGVFRSTDGGQTWTNLPGFTTAVNAALGGAPGAGFAKVVVDIAPPTSPPNAAGVQVMYASAEGTGGATDPVGLFSSTDGGTTWTARKAKGMPNSTQTPPAGTQGGYSFHMAVDPASPGDGVKDIIYFGTVALATSTNSGDNFTAPTNAPHADCHAWAFVKQPAPAQSIVYSGNDGGLSRSVDGGQNYTQIGGGGLQTALLFNIDVRPADAGVVVAAAQDNGLLTTSGATSPAWASPGGGDGFDIAYDGVTAGTVYGTSGFWPAPCTRVFVSTKDGTDFPSTVPSAKEITPWGTTSDQNCGVFPITTDPSNAGTVYVSGNQNLWQTRNGGTNWRILRLFNGIGNVDVAPSNGNNVVIAVGNRVWVSTNALAATVVPPTGVTFTDITRALPSRNVIRAVFDPNDPTVIYAVIGGFNGVGPNQRGHVFRTTITATAWTDISPTAPLDPSDPVAEPIDIPFNAIALDGADTPTTIYVGTDLGVLRSVDGGQSWSVLDDLHFPRVPVTDLVLNRAAGVLCAGTYGRGAFMFAKPSVPTIAVNPEDDLIFGTTCGPAALTLQVFNVGAGDLVIDSVQRLMGSTGFRVLTNPATPLIVGQGEDISFTIEFDPTTPGTPETAIIRIVSNDPGARTVDLLATGTGGIAALETVIPDNGDFGNACLGSFVDEPLTINNSGTCPLLIASITASPNFLAPSVLAYPLRVDSGDSIDVVVRFQPTVHGPSLPGAITIVSNDPASPHVVPVRGAAPAPKANVIIANAGDFGEVRLGKFTDRDLVINNLGPCPLRVTGIVSAAPVVFVTPSVVGFPLTVDGGDSIAVPIRFQPTNRGSAAAVLTISSDDPSSPAVVPVSGTAWPPLPIAGSPIEGYRLSNDSQHVNYIGTDKHVHELYITAGAAWVDNDLTEEAGAVPPITTPATSALEGYRLGDDSQHVFFIGTDNHVYELYITAGAGWIYNDLTALARAVPPNPTTALDGFRLGDDSKHVIFIGTDGHVHELQIARGGRWADNDLTTLAGPGAVLPNPTTALDGFRLGDDSEHVNFIGIDGHVHELTHTGAGWVDHNLTTLAGAGAVLPTAGSALDGFRLSDDSEHVFFIGTDSHVHELTHTGAGWADNDLTTLASAVPPIPTTALDGYRLSNDSKHVNFIGTDNHVHELYFTTAAGWVDNDLTALT